MAFGISFGSNKKKSTQTSDVTKTEDQVQSGVTSQDQTQTTSQTATTSGTQTGTTTGSTTGSTTGTSNQQASGTQSSTQRSQSLSDVILGALEASSLRALQSAEAPGGPAASSLNGFDLDSFVQNGYAAAEAQQRGNLEQSINGLFDSVGGTASGNSMAALLANRLQGDATANLAGIQANLVGQGNQILRENVGASVAERAAQQSYVANLLNQLKGGVTAATGEAATTEQTLGQTQQQTAEQQAQQQATTSQQTQQTDTTQVLASIINQLLNTQTNTVGHETTVGKEKKSGGGFGLSI